MNILNLSLEKNILNVDEKWFDKDLYYLILTTPDELDNIKDDLEIDERIFNECIHFDDNIKIDTFSEYDYISLNTFSIKEDKVVIEEVNLFLANNYLLLVLEEHSSLYRYVENIILNSKTYIHETPVVTLFKINYMIFKFIIVNGFEALSKVEDIILEIEDDIMNKVSSSHIYRVNNVRNMCRSIVKSIRPLLYISDDIIKEDVRYLKYEEVKIYNQENNLNINFEIDKLYKFSISTRELADKLIDIYSSKVTEKTNSLITKLTLLTAISSPLTIITGIYGMNFENMPELKFAYGYPIVLIIMLIIVIVGIYFFTKKKLL